MGVDPGSRVMGFGVLRKEGTSVRHVDHGTLSMDGRFSHRLVEIGKGVAQLLEELKPDVVVIEKIFLGKNADSAFKLGHARGVALYEVGRRQIPIFEYDATAIKKGITGNGHATKEQVRAITFGLLQINSLAKLDASDALSVALYHSRNLEVLEQFSRMNHGLPPDLQLQEI